MFKTYSSSSSLVKTSAGSRQAAWWLPYLWDWSISQEILDSHQSQNFLKMTHLEFHSNLPGVNEFNNWIQMVQLLVLLYFINVSVRVVWFQVPVSWNLEICCRFYQNILTWNLTHAVSQVHPLIFQVFSFRGHRKQKPCFMQNLHYAAQ